MVVAFLLDPKDENMTIALIVMFWIAALMALFGFAYFVWGWS